MHFTCRELSFRYFKHLPAKLYFAANTHFPFVEENVLFIAKNIFQTKHRPQRIFPIAVFSFCLSHTFITHAVIYIFILYYSFLFYCPIFYGNGLVVLRQWVTFSQYSPACKKEPPDSDPNFYTWANGAFFPQHAQDQCVILLRTHFAVPALHKALHSTKYKINICFQQATAWLVLNNYYLNANWGLTWVLSQSSNCRQEFVMPFLHSQR